MTPRPLSPTAFASALSHGRGSAFLHIQHAGLEDVADLVLACCLKNPVFDRQCESSRAPWLLKMFGNSNQYDRFSREIVAALRRETDGHDLQHLCELAALMGKNGDQAAAQALRTRVLQPSFPVADIPLVFHALFVLDGDVAIVEMVRRFGRLLLAHPDEEVHALSCLIEDCGALERAQTVLEQQAEQDAAIKAYLENQRVYAEQVDQALSTSESERQSAVRDRVRAELTIAKILENAYGCVGESPGPYGRFGRHATEEERATVFACLLAETDEQICLRLLWIFRSVGPPALHPRLWEFATSDQQALRHAALTALAQVCDPAIGNFARTALRWTAFSANDSVVLGLFINNFKPSDAGLILAALRKLSPSDEEAHDLATSVLAICKKNATPVCAELMRWVYETNPCTICRRDAVAWMIDHAGVPQDIAFECLYDADQDIQELARLHAK